MSHRLTLWVIIGMTWLIAFSIIYLKEMPRWTGFAGMGLIMARWRWRSSGVRPNSTVADRVHR